MVLIACSKTGRASWADFEPLAKHNGGFRWVGNLPAVPDLKAAGSKKGASSGAATGGGSDAGILSNDSIFWGGYQCEVCKSGSSPVPGHEDSLFWQCGTCQTLYCSGGFEQTGEDAWYLTCPGCGRLSVLRAYEETGTISEYQASTGRSEGSERRKLTGGGSNDVRQLPHR